MKGNSRLLAILLTDLSDFTAFSSHAERSGVIDTVRQQKSLIEPIVAEFRGRLVKWIGDAALVAFESATDAIHCGRAIQNRFMSEAERGVSSLPSSIKVVVHVGDVSVDSDGDIYGDAVNITARMEKAATPDEIYFSETVRGIISHAEVPYEYVGTFEFKGAAEKIKIFRTCFGQPPVVQEKSVLVQTNFVSANDLAEKYGWRFVHPVLDNITSAIINATRSNGGTNRGVMHTGCFLTFRSVKAALSAIREWERNRLQLIPPNCGADEFKVRVGVHVGTLHLMKHTMLGEDIELLRTLAPLGHGNEALLTQAAVDAALSDGCRADEFVPADSGFLRECGSKIRWTRRFSHVPVFKVSPSASENLD